MPLDSLDAEARIVRITARGVAPPVRPVVAVAAGVGADFEVAHCFSFWAGSFEGAARAKTMLECRDVDGGAEAL